jgi:predicted MPP superfamily phosphohydrolase
MSRGAVVLWSALIALMGSHLVVFLCVARLMKRTRLLTRGLLLFVFLLIPFTFPAAWIWNRVNSGIGPRLLHMCSSVWLGFVLNVILCLAAALLCAGVGRLFKRRIQGDALIRLVFGMALVLTLFGFVNTKFPRVKEIRVAVNDLPPNWHHKTIVHLTDVHLGAVHGKGFLRRLVRKVNGLDPDLVVITGDLFDGLTVDCTPYVPGLNELRSRNGVFFVTGNHEGYIGVSAALTALAKTNIRVLDDEVVDIDGLQLVGASYPVYGEKRKRRFPDLEGYRKEVPSILLYHTPTGLRGSYEDPGSQQLSTYFFPEPDFSLAQEMGIDLQLSGHTHAGQTFPFGLLTRHLFRGFDRGLHRVGDFQIYVSPGAGTWGPPMRIGQNSEITVVRLLPPAPRPTLPAVGCRRDP